MTPDLATVASMVTDVEGWMTPDQAATLHDAARHCPEGGSIVEIGSFRGRSTIVLAASAPSSASIVAIDPHAGNDRGPQEIDGYESAAEKDHDAFHANLRAAGVDHEVRHVRAFSAEALQLVEGDVDVLYIDGAHRYGPARADISSWGDRVRDHGVLLIHDSFSSVGVTLAIVRELFWGTRFRYVGRSRSLAVYRADLEGGAARLRNAARQIGQLAWFIRNLVLKVLLSLGLDRLLGSRTPEWPY